MSPGPGNQPDTHRESTFLKFNWLFNVLKIENCLVYLSCSDFAKTVKGYRRKNMQKRSIMVDDTMPIPKVTAADC